VAGAGLHGGFHFQWRAGLVGFANLVLDGLQLGGFGV
jgi:hypothetical protein